MTRESFSTKALIEPSSVQNVLCGVMKSLVTIHSESLKENWGKLCIQMTGLFTTWIASLYMFFL